MSAIVWIVIWTVTITVPASCPGHQLDPYTGEYPTTSCLVLHTETITKEMEREFTTEKEAKEFIKNAPDYIKPNMVLKAREK